MFGILEISQNKGDHVFLKMTAYKNLYATGFSQNNLGTFILRESLNREYYSRFRRFGAAKSRSKWKTWLHAIITEKFVELKMLIVVTLISNICIIQF